MQLKSLTILSDYNVKNAMNISIYNVNDYFKS